MAIVGFNFSKVNAEKNEGVAGKIKISNNIALSNVKEAKLPFVSKDDKGVTFSFKFHSVFEVEGSKEELGKIELEGNIVEVLKKDVAEKALGSWGKKEKLEDPVLEVILNYALEKCNVEAILLSKEMNLPPPVRMPRVAKKD